MYVSNHSKLRFKDEDIRQPPQKALGIFRKRRVIEDANGEKSKKTPYMGPYREPAEASQLLSEEQQKVLITKTQQLHAKKGGSAENLLENSVFLLGAAMVLYGFMSPVILPIPESAPVLQLLFWIPLGAYIMHKTKNRIIPDPHVTLKRASFELLQKKELSSPALRSSLVSYLMLSTEVAGENRKKLADIFDKSCRGETLSKEERTFIEKFEPPSSIKRFASSLFREACKTTESMAPIPVFILGIAIAPVYFVLKVASFMIEMAGAIGYYTKDWIERRAKRLGQAKEASAEKGSSINALEKKIRVEISECPSAVDAPRNDGQDAIENEEVEIVPAGLPSDVLGKKS